MLVGGVPIVSLHDAIADPVAQVVALLHRAVVDPARELGLVDVGGERRLDFLLTALRQRWEVRVAHLAGSQLGDEFGRALDQRAFEHRGVFVVDERDGLLDVRVLVRDHVDEAILDIGIHPFGRAKRFETDL